MNINLWFARDIHTDEIVSILDAKQDNKYCCPICNSEAIPKALESKKVTPHFAHIDRSKCSSEAMIHWWYKHRFIEAGDTFTIKTDKEIQFTCKSFEVEKEYVLSNGTYKPDLVVYTECGNEIIFEMANTNKKKVEDYIDQWIELNKIVVEVDIKLMVNDNKAFNALYYNGKCFNFNKRDGGYYNTIGKLKEDMIADGEYDIEKIRQLDWFWGELFKYKLSNDENISDLMISMEILINDDNFHVVENAIKKHKLGKIYDDYSKFIKLKYKNYLDDFKSKFEKYEIIFEIQVSHFTHFHHVCHVEIKRENYRKYATIYNTEYIIEKISKEIHKIEESIYCDLLSVAYCDKIKSSVKYQMIYLNDLIRRKFNFNDKHVLKLMDINLDNETIKLSYEYDNCEIKHFNVSIQNENFIIYNDIQEKLLNYISENINTLIDIDLLVSIYNQNLSIDVGEYSDINLDVDFDDITKPSIRIEKAWFDNSYEYKIENGRIYNDYNKEIKTLDEFISDFYSVVHTKYIRNKKCTSCCEKLNLNKRDLIFFHQKGLTIPKRCKSCRQQRKKGE